MTPAFSMTSDGWRSDQPPKRDPAQLMQGYSLLESFRGTAPGSWVENKYEQVNHYKGIAYIAVQSVLSLHGGIIPSVGRKRRHKRLSKSPTTFLPGGRVTKSLPSHSPGSAHHEDYDPVDGHPLNDLIEMPNDRESFSELDCYLTLQYLLTGDGMLWVVPSKAKKPVECWALPTALTTPHQQKSPMYPEGSWRVNPYYTSGMMGYLPGGFAGTGAIVPGTEVKRFLNFDPLYRWNGKSPLGSGAYQVDILEQIDEARWAAFNHGVMADAVIQLDGADDATCRRVEEKMTQKLGGSRNARRIAVVSGIPGQQNAAKVQQLSNSPREMDFGNSYEQQMAVVCALWGVPSIVPGLKTAGTYSELYAAKAQLREAQRDTVRRKSEFYSKALAWPFCRYPGEYRIQLDLPPNDDPDLLEKQLKQDADLGTITWNEYRRARNRSTDVNGDVPVSVFVEQVQQKKAPEEPKPAPGVNPFGGAGADAGSLDDSTSGLDQPTAGAVPKPANDAAAGSLPPRPEVAKAMSAYGDAAGGALVGTAKRKRKVLRAKRAVSSLLKSL